MAESTLVLGYTQLADLVGSYLGWGPGIWSASMPWPTTKQTHDADECVKAGVSKFYYTTPPYDWSFMHPYVTVTIPQGMQSVPLPQDVAGVEGGITAKTGSNPVPWQIEFTSAAKIKLLYATTPGATGRPVAAAVDFNKGTTSLSGQLGKVLIFPQADVAYDLEFKAYVTPDAPTVANPFVYGGAQHRETIKEACLSAAEQLLDDKMSVHTQLFAERLAASMAIDGRNKPQVFGYNGDRSDEKRGHRQSNGHYFPVLGTYNGGSLG